MLYKNKISFRNTKSKKATDMIIKKQRMDHESKDFLENVKSLAGHKHLNVESLKNSSKFKRLMSESGKFSLNTFFKTVF